MKIYTDAVGAPNPKKLRVYCAEKGLNIPFETIDIMTGQNRTPEFAKKNPLMGLPVLELDDGRCLSESLAIMEYLEEAHPTPPMLGATPIERAGTRELERICELGVLTPVGTIFQNTSPFFAGRLKQSPEAAENARGRFAQVLKVPASAPVPLWRGRGRRLPTARCSRRLASPNSPASNPIPRVKTSRVGTTPSSSGRVRRPEAAGRHAPG